MPQGAGIRLFRVCLLVLAALFAAGCTPSLGVFSYDCQDWQKLTDEEKESIESAAFDIINTFASIDLDRFLKLSYPGVFKAENNDKLTSLMETFKGFSPDIKAAKMIVGRLINITGVGSTPHRIICSDAGDMESERQIILQTIGSISNLAVFITRIPCSNEDSYDVSLIMTKKESTYELLRFDINASNRGGRNAAYFSELAENSYSADKILPAFIFYLMADILSAHGPVVTTGFHNKIVGDLKAVKNELDAVDNIITIDAVGRKYRLYKIGLTGHEGNIVPFVHYLSKEEFEPVKTRREAGLILEYFEKEYPQLAMEFPGIQFKACKDPPKYDNEEEKNIKLFLTFSSKPLKIQS